MQLPADQIAFIAAKAIVDPEERLAAWRHFVKDYPDSLRIQPAGKEILQVLVKNFPERSEEIHKEAEAMVLNLGKNVKKYSEEYYVAGLLADAGTKGVDLPDAENWAKDAVALLTEANFDEQAVAADKMQNEPAPTPEARHRTFAKFRANALASLANVYLDEGRLLECQATLLEAYGLAPTLSKLSVLRGRLALLQHHNTEALGDFERAQLLGDLRSPWREKMMDLYRQAHGGRDAGFVTSMDEQYARLFPPPFTPARHEPVKGGHTVLFELFTGSACAPCVAGDLAVEQMLKAYPRKEVVALELDEHIPEPDPLTNPDGVARGAVFNVLSTPSYVLDGIKLTLHGGTREDSQEIYSKLTKVLDAQEARPNPVQLKLTAERGPDGLVHARAVVTLGDEKALVASLSSTAVSSGKPLPSATPKASPIDSRPPAISVNFALVEDEIRYPGENGIRFHHMVVRSLASSAAAGQTIAAASTSAVNATFDPAAISAKWATYLTSYETGNDRFGKVKFLSKDTAMQPDRLAVAVWVQDSATHRVLQAAFLPVSPERMAK